MTKISIAGLLVDPLTKPELLEQIQEKLEHNEKVFIVTPYSEFLYKSLTDSAILPALNSATFSIADGIGIMWAATFLEKPFTAKSFYGKTVEGVWQIVATGASILLNPKRVKKILPEKIVGADIFWDLSKLATEKDLSVYILGGFGNTPKVVAQKLQEKYPSIRVAGTSNKDADDLSIIEDIQSAKPDLLFVGLGPIRQEQWIAKYIEQLPIKLAIGLGGTFDYVAGNVARPPQFLRSIGLEWLYRLFTQPKRIKRIWNGTVGLVQALLRYKVYTSLPYRKNVVCVAVNTNHQVLLCKRNPDKHQQQLKKFGRKSDDNIFENYWQLPQGGIEIKEELYPAAQRELQEETGILSARIIKTSTHVHRYDWKNATRPLFNNPAHTRGQEQQIVYFSFLGNDDEIKIDKQEFVDYKWVGIDQLLDTLHAERKPLGKIVVRDFDTLQG